MRIVVDLRKRFGRDAVISFEDRSLEVDCPAHVRDNLETDLHDLMKVFGGLAISVIEDRSAEVPDRHRIMDEIMELLERYATVKIQHESITLQ